MADIEHHGVSPDESIETVLPDVVTTVQDEKDAKELENRTGYKQVMKRRVRDPATVFRIIIISPPLRSFSLTK